MPLGLYYALSFKISKYLGTLIQVESIIVTYGGTVLSGIAAIVWLVRLEGKTEAVAKANTETQKDVDELRIRHEVLDVKIVEQLSKVRESLARLEGYFSASNGAAKPVAKD